MSFTMQIMGKLSLRTGLDGWASFVAFARASLPKVNATFKMLDGKQLEDLRYSEFYKWKSEDSP